MRATPEFGVARRDDDLLVENVKAENVKNDNSFQQAVRGCSSAMAINAPGKMAAYVTRDRVKKPGERVQTHKRRREDNNE
jgi:hypothetical protein